MLQDIWTVFWRDWVVLHRRLGRYILSRMISPILYLVAFGWGVGRSVPVNNGNYLDFIVPGIIALNSMNISFNAVGSPLNMSRLYHKTLEEYLIAPIHTVTIVIGKVLSGVLRGLISSLVIILLAYLFGAHFAVSGWFILALTLNCAIFASLGLVAAMIMNSHEEMASFNTYVLTPMSFLCATFFTPDRLPVAVRWLVELLPLTHSSYTLRMIATGRDLPVVSIAVMVFYCGLFLGIGIWKMGRVRE